MRNIPYDDESFDRHPRRAEKWAKRQKAREHWSVEAEPSPGDSDCWSTWGDGEQGPQPYPPWLVTDTCAVDHELGLITSGCKADVSLVARAVPDHIEARGPRECLLVAKRYRVRDVSARHRDSAFLQGRRTRTSREQRAMSKRTAFGRDMIVQNYAAVEFANLAKLYSAGASVPYPAQRIGTELLLEFIGTPEGQAATRLVGCKPDPDEANELWLQLFATLLTFAECGLAHGDLSPYNVVVHDGRVVVIDLRHAVDVANDPSGGGQLRNNVHAIAPWFIARGVPLKFDELDDVVAELAHAAKVPAPRAADDEFDVDSM
jgi:RIO kinase 1